MANYLERIFDDFKELARSKRKENKKFFARLSKHEGKKLNAQFHAMHEEVFAETDCLKCARCCRATGPLLTKQDIARISKKQGMKAADFEARYLRVDEDGDWVMNSLPCPFLALDTNKCTIRICAQGLPPIPAYGSSKHEIYTSAHRNQCTALSGCL